jgi:PhnB protein
MIHELYCYLRPASAARAISFYKAAFGAVEKFRLTEPGTGRIGHAELRLGEVSLMLSDAYPEAGIEAQTADLPARFAIHLHVDDADATIAAAGEAGAIVIRPAMDQFYGERSGTVPDPFGYNWVIGHTIETVTPEEMQRRLDDVMRE